MKHASLEQYAKLVSEGKKEGGSTTAKAADQKTGAKNGTHTKTNVNAAGGGGQKAKDSDDDGGSELSQTSDIEPMEDDEDQEDGGLQEEEKQAE